MSTTEQTSPIPPSSPVPHRPARRRSIHANTINNSTNSTKMSKETSNFILNETNSNGEDYQETNDSHDEDSNLDESDAVNENINGNSEDDSESENLNETEEELETIRHNYKTAKSPKKIKINNTSTSFSNSTNCIITEENVSSSNYKKDLPIIIVAVVIGLLVLGLGTFISSDTREVNDLKTIKENFPTQDDFLWLAFDSGVEDVVTLNRPSTFILLYQQEAEDILNSLLEQLSKYATCKITECSKEPVIITDSILNSSEVVNNYGLIIVKYKENLKENGVMIIKNLENVQGVSAQAFHSFCDEFTPLVQKSLFVFTMKVERLHGDDKMKFVEDYFRKKWTDIKIDTFNALITRITSMVVEIMP